MGYNDLRLGGYTESRLYQSAAAFLLINNSPDNELLMNTFPHYPVNAKSLAMRRPVFGVGKNDADYVTGPTINGKQVICPLYRSWKNMLNRCYSPAYHLKHPTYIDCTVTDEWLTFSVFRRWVVGQDWQGNELDKDLLIQGNKIYGPEACVFVSQAINALLADCVSSRGKYPQGVSFHEGRFQAQLRINGKGRYIGLFDTPEGAEIAYKTSKASYVRSMAHSQSTIVKNALISVADRMDRDLLC